MSAALALRQWVKARQHPLARLAYALAKGCSSAAVPVIPALHGTLYRLRGGALALVASARRALWDTPLFLSQVRQRPRRVMLYGGIPLMMGPLDITLDEDCRISGQTTITGRTSARSTPRLIIGSNCDIGWQTTLAVGTAIRIGNNVRIAGRAFLAGYPGHPLDAAARAAGLPEHDSQCGDIVLEDDVWLATNVSVSAGVTIGRGTIVAAGSVVTKDLPAFVLAGGVPARVIRPLQTGDASPFASKETSDANA